MAGRKEVTGENTKQQKNGGPRGLKFLLDFASLNPESSRLPEPRSPGRCCGCADSLRGTDAEVWPTVNRGQVCREEPVLEVRQHHLTPAAPLQTFLDADAELFTKRTETPRPAVCVRDAPK